MARGIYLDNSMITRPSERAVAAMLPFYSDSWGNPSAPHQVGQEAYPAIEQSLKSVYSLLGAGPEDSFVFTSSGAEAVNQAIFSSYLNVTLSTGKNHFLVGHADEAPALMSINRLEKMGCVGKMIDASPEGIITSEMVAEALSPRTALLSLSWANGLTGVIQPVKEIAQLCKERGVLFHLDATHVLGRLFYQLDEIGPDFLTFNGDHLHAPQGTGGLLIRSGVSVSPLIAGGLEQGGLRAGSMNVPALVALGVAARETEEARDLVCTEVARLRDQFEAGIQAVLPDSVIFFKDSERLPHCTAIGFPGIANEALLYALNRKNVFASIGGGSFQQIALVLIAAGIPASLAHTAIHFSLSRYNHEEEIERAITLISEAVQLLKKCSINNQASKS